MKTKLPVVSNITPGEILLEEWITPHDLTCYQVSQRTGIPASRLTEITKGRRAITADTGIPASRRHTELAVCDDIETVYKPLRRHSSLGRVSPVVFEKQPTLNIKAA